MSYETPERHLPHDITQSYLPLTQINAQSIK